eukprot:3705650-Pyramimonas_sp.AAC.1
MRARPSATPPIMAVILRHVPFVFKSLRAAIIYGGPDAATSSLRGSVACGPTAGGRPQRGTVRRMPRRGTIAAEFRRALA